MKHLTHASQIDVSALKLSLNDLAGLLAMFPTPHEEPWAAKGDAPDRRGLYLPEEMHLLTEAWGREAAQAREIAADLLLERWNGEKTRLEENVAEYIHTTGEYVWLSRIQQEKPGSVLHAWLLDRQPKWFEAVQGEMDTLFPPHLDNFGEAACQSLANWFDPPDERDVLDWVIDETDRALLIGWRGYEAVHGIQRLVWMGAPNYPVFEANFPDLRRQRGIGFLWGLNLTYDEPFGWLSLSCWVGLSKVLNIPIPEGVTQESVQRWLVTKELLRICPKTG